MSNSNIYSEVHIHWIESSDTATYQGLPPNRTTFYQSEIPLLLLSKFPGFFLNGKRPRSPGGGKTRRSGTEKRCSHKWFHIIFSCTNPCTDTFLTRLRSPWKPTRRCEPKEGYLRCSKRFDHRSHSIIFLLFEFKSVRWCWRWETQRNARVAFKPTRRSR